MKIVIKETPETINSFIGKSVLYVNTTKTITIHKGILKGEASKYILDLNRMNYQKYKKKWIKHFKKYALEKPLEKCIVIIDIYFNDIRKRDMDNYLKAVQDGLTKNNIIKDDNYVDCLVLSFGHYDKDDPRVEITIKENSDLIETINKIKELVT